MRTLLRPRWIVGHLLVVAVLFTFVNLGLWQLRRLAEVRERNALISARLAAPPTSLATLVARVGDDPEALAYRRVQVRGTYLPRPQLLTQPRSRDGRPVQHVLTALRPPGRDAVLADRGSVPFTRRFSSQELPPPVGTVQVEGVLLPPEPGQPSASEQVTRVVPDALEARLDTALLSTPLLVREQRPGSAGPIRRGELPALDEGSHLSYAIQWFLFATVTLVGYPLLLRRSVREQQEATTSPPSEASVSLSRARRRPRHWMASGAQWRQSRQISRLTPPGNQSGRGTTS